MCKPDISKEHGPVIIYWGVLIFLLINTCVVSIYYLILNLGRVGSLENAQLIICIMFIIVDLMLLVLVLLRVSIAISNIYCCSNYCRRNVFCEGFESLILLDILIFSVAIVAMILDIIGIPLIGFTFETFMSDLGIACTAGLMWMADCVFGPSGAYRDGFEVIN
eukprot:TRINITY_DN10894_c0_g1_i1.p1 TRINITY_DN10894_c0_g1~~TRINITY_DN10894_c0_g1_i1.p1  ORF type:complete len:164 (+),score=9.15 TRINITY_DN10894_c0_g1_i1:14-505(+)